MAKSDTFHCADCKQTKPVQKDGGTGYAETRGGRKICYACCGIRDRKSIAKGEFQVLYLTAREKDGQCYHEVSNWPGTLAYRVRYVRSGRHNIAGTRLDIWFTAEGLEWHGIQYGEDTQIVRCRPVKFKS